MAFTLKEVIEQLQENNSIALGTNTNILNLAKIITAQGKSTGDDLEAKLDKARTKKPLPTTPTSFQKGQASGENFSLGALLNPAALIGPLIAGVAAFGAGLAGLRGWETKAIKSIKDTLKSKVPLTISNGMLKIRNATLGMFGLTAEGLLTRDAKGRFTKAAPISTQIGMKMNALRIRALGMFGLGADGKLLAVKDGDGLFKKNIVGRVTFQINRLLSPLMRVSAGIAGFATGAGKDLFAFIRGNILGPVGKVMGLFGRILAPLGFLFSAKKAVDAFMGEEGSVYDKSKAGFKTFISDFLGAPLDLLKNASVWILKNLLGIESDENGKIKEGQGLGGDILKAIQAFSFTESISNLIEGVFSIGEGAFKWFSDLFTGEKTIGQSLDILFKAWLGAAASIADWAYNTAIKPITEWFAEKLGFDIELPSLDIKTMVTDAYERIKINFLSSMEDLVIWFMTMPKRIGLELETEFALGIGRLKAGFVEFAGILAKLPNIATAAALNKLKENLEPYGLFPGILQRKLDSANAKIEGKDQATEARLERIDSETAKKLGDINKRRSELDDLRQTLIDNKQYNNVTNNSSGIVIEQESSAIDNLNGGSFDVIGAR